MSDTVLVTGASGFVGLNVVEALLGAGRPVARSTKTWTK